MRLSELGRRAVLAGAASMVAAGAAHAVTITYDAQNRPILFEDVTYSASPAYDVAITWGQSFETTFGSGYKNPGQPFDEPAFLGDGTVFNQMQALMQALVDDGYATPIGRGSADVPSLLVVPRTLSESTSTPGEWFVTGQRNNLGFNVSNLLAGQNPITLRDDWVEAVDAALLSELGYTRWALSSTGWGVTLDGSDSVLSENGAEVLRVPVAGPDPLVVNGSFGDDQLVVDFGAGNPIPGGGIQFEGGSGAGFDGIALEGGTAGNVLFEHANLNDGAITVDGHTITYTGLEPISSTISAASVDLVYSAAAETIDVSGAGPGMTQVTSTAGESVTFLHPSTSLTIDTAAADADTINLSSLGAGFGASLTLDADSSDLVNVGGSGPGSVFTGGLTLLGGPVISFDLLGAAPGSGYDQLVVNGTVDLGTGLSLLDLLLGFTPVIGDTFVLIDNDATDAVLGSFSGLAEGASFALGATSFGISYVGGDGNDVVLSVLAPGGGDPSVPAPATLALAVTGLLGAAWRRRRG